ncbi:MAG: hypothetical protein QOF56_2130, partial [Acidobacteriaceae bacterium]|nr:hypothetical protein [Acidobacteriaceae bacterium]
GPNFAYDLCLRKVTPEQRAALDLSSWTVACNGAEPVRTETLDQFAAAFAPCGFRRSAFYPAYGLAEATLKVAGGQKGDAPSYIYVQASALEQNRIVELSEVEQNEAARPLVGLGRADIDTKVVIVDPETLVQCLPQQVGEIWVSGPSVTQGYWNRPNETETTFRAYVADTRNGPFLRTGDLGFLKDGQLFVTGRLKDLIIIRGRNHYPQDFELTMERSHAALKPESGTAFSVDMRGEEHLVLVQELQTRRHPNPDAIIENIRQSIAEIHEVQPAAVLLIKPGDIPKTSSGKIQRHKCRQKFLSGDFNVVAEWRAGDDAESEPAVLESTTFLRSKEEIESSLRLQVAAKLRLDSSGIDVNQPITRYGLDSLMVVELAHSLETRLRVTLPIATILQGPSIAELAARIYEELGTASSGPEFVPVASTHDKTCAHPLSYGQQSLWFLHQMSPESSAYNIAGALRVRSHLDVQALRRAFQMLVDRHPSLRTTFTVRRGEPLQVVREGTKVCFRVEDAGEWNETFLNERLSGESRQPFDLEQGPPLRLSLFTLSTDEHVLLLVVHHIVADFWSLEVLLDELRVLYPAARRGIDPGLPPVRLQYRDYVRWQSEMLSSPRGDDLWAYWRKQLGDELPVLNLPTDRPRPAVQTHRGACESFRLSVELTNKLKNLGQTHNATLYTTLLAAFQVLLHRYSAQDVILVGSPTAGRSRAGLSEVVGYFVNPLVLRADLSTNPTFNLFLDQVRETVLAALEHQEFPFALLVDRLQPERDPSRSPLFQVMFVLQKAHRINDEGLSAFALNESGARIKLGELDLESVALEQRVAQFDLTLTMAEVERDLRGSFEYNADLFDAATIRRMSGHFLALLESIVADAEQRLSQLPLLTEGEHRKLLVEWNQTAKEYPQELCIHEVVEQQAERAPDTVAVIFEKEQLSYGELNRRANQLCRYLRRLGVGSEAHVAILMERSVEMVVGLLGILKAGGAYVPLDPAYPQERLSFMLKDAAVALVLTQQRLSEKLPEDHEARLVCLDAEWESIAVESEENPALNCGADNQAYVIYTSGSSGQPKGVMVTHQALVNRALAMAEIYGMGASDRSLQFFSLSFDAATEEIFTTLVSGGSLVLHANPAQMAPEDFLSECERLG